MAKIKGYELKKIQEWTGRDGYGLRCDIYHSGKLIGNFFDEAHGGETECEIDSLDEKKELIKTARRSCKDNEGADEQHFIDDDEFVINCFISRIQNLRATEKEFKKNIKKGFTVTAQFKAKNGFSYTAGYNTIVNAKKDLERPDADASEIHYYTAESFDIK